MAFLRRKSVIITICVLIGTLVFSTVGLIVVYALNNNKENDKLILSVNAYDFASGSITSDSYSSYTIGSLAAWQNFANSVNSGLTFSGRTVQLTANINFGGSSSILKSCFSGVFNGQGYTLSNISTYGEGVVITSANPSALVFYSLFPLKRLSY